MDLLAGQRVRGTPANMQIDLHIQAPIYTVNAIICTESSTHSSTYLQLCMPSYVQKVMCVWLVSGDLSKF